MVGLMLIPIAFAIVEEWSHGVHGKKHPEDFS
jgi:hypothetical protein